MGFSLDYATSSGKKSANTQIIVGPGTMRGIDVMPPTTNQATVIVYDSEDSNVSGKLILCEAHVDAGMPTLNHEYNAPIVCNRGIYVTISGTGAEFIVRYTFG